MVVCVYGRPTHPHQTETGRNRRTTPTETPKPCPSHSRRSTRTRPLPQTRKMFLRTRENRLSRDHSRQRQTGNGPTKAERCRGLASTQKPHRCPFLSRVYWLLPILRPELL